MLFSDRDGREARDGGRGHFRHVVEIENGGTFDRDRARAGRGAVQTAARHCQQVENDAIRTRNVSRLRVRVWDSMG